MEIPKSDQVLYRLMEAVYQVLKIQPTITLDGVRTVLAVHLNEGPIGYQALADRLEMDYQEVGIRAGVLSDGRGGQNGAFLLERIRGGDRREKLLVLTDRGRQICDLLATSDPEADDPLTVIDQVFDRLDQTRMRASTAFVFLRVGLNDPLIRECRIPAGALFQNRPLHNLPRHLNSLQEAGLIERMVVPEDGRASPPVLTEKGQALFEDLRGLTHHSSPLLETPDTPIDASPEPV